MRDFTSPTGGTVDRNTTFPTTRVRIFAGTYTLVGDLLTMLFTQAQSNDPTHRKATSATLRRSRG